ncbi:hypothetical protein [Mesorhizobium sp. INR15]|uniref:hypothetical protein n=1 Tax=Mesorhizobium sp. INR15 TaxID=2654248 RepID=UPI001896527B|nr:hypothetical protein [Mesorhizobium sp. INR15]QPC91861.1 hypothetical protein GA829_15400 [Mesorhizobium sp. INR15]
MFSRTTSVMTVLALLGITAGAMAASNRPTTYEKTALSGQEIYIFLDTNLNPDCTSAGMDDVKAISGPNHGSIRIVDGKVYPNYPKGSDRYKCNSQSDDGIQAFYKSAPGFKGQDQVSLSIHTFTGNARDVVVTINVE